jgi:protein-tyrosine phosphatase
VFEIRDWLYIGKYSETVNLSFLKPYGIGAMLHLAAPVQHPGIELLYLAVDDAVPLAPATLKEGVGFIREQKALGKVVLVACGAGISRSSTFALAALKEEENLDLATAYRAILTHHPDALPHASLWESLSAYYSETLDHQQVWLQARRLPGK